MQYTDNYVLYFDYKNSTTKNNLVIVTIKIADIREEDIIVACMFWRENFRHVKIGHTLLHKKYAGISKILVLTSLWKMCSPLIVIGLTYLPKIDGA